MCSSFFVQIIEDLASEGRLNGQTFCIQCMARKPLRSKHCRICDRCIARSDQYDFSLAHDRPLTDFVQSLPMGLELRRLQ